LGAAGPAGITGPADSAEGIHSGDPLIKKCVVCALGIASRETTPPGMCEFQTAD